MAKRGSITCSLHSSLCRCLSIGSSNYESRPRLPCYLPQPSQPCAPHSFSSQLALKPSNMVEKDVSEANKLKFAVSALDTALMSEFRYHPGVAFREMRAALIKNPPHVIPSVSGISKLQTQQSDLVQIDVDVALNRVPNSIMGQLHKMRYPRSMNMGTYYRLVSQFVVVTLLRTDASGAGTQLERLAEKHSETGVVETAGKRAPVPRLPAPRPQPTTPTGALPPPLPPPLSEGLSGLPRLLFPCGACIWPGVLYRRSVCTGN